MYQFCCNGLLVTWTMLVHQTSQQGTSGENSDGFQDIADPRNILPDLRMYLALHKEEQPMRNFNVLEHFSVLGQSLEMHYWNSKSWYSLPHITFVFVDQKLTNDWWIERLHETAQLEQFCCPVAEYYGLGDDKCHWRCNLATVPFLVMHKSTRLRITTSIGTLTQYIFTYCFLSPEISSTVEIHSISHVVNDDIVHSRIVISHILQEQRHDQSLQYWLVSPQSRKVVLLFKDEPQTSQNVIGHPYSTAFTLPYRHLRIPQRHDYVPPPLVTAQYQCYKHGSQVSNTLRENSSDSIRMGLGMDAKTNDVILYLDIAVTDENSYAAYNCVARFEAKNTFHHPQTPADKRVFYIIHFPVIQIEPFTLKEIALNIYAVFKSLMEKIDSGPLVLNMTELSRFRPSLHQLEKWQEGKDIEHRYLFAHMTANKCLDQLFVVKGVFWMIAGVTVIGIILSPLISFVSAQTASRVHRETIATLQHLRSSGPRLEAQLRYDVFLSYSSVDRLWVEKELLNKLEMEGYQVCYDQRHEDFPAGRPIAASIQNAILSSRKTVAVFSPDYLSSGWTMHEIIMVHTGINDGDIAADSLVVIKYRTCSIPLHLRHTTYNNWTNPHMRDTFLETIYSWLPYFVVKRFSVALRGKERRRRFWEGLFRNIGEPKQFN